MSEKEKKFIEAVSKLIHYQDLSKEEMQTLLDNTRIVGYLFDLEFVQGFGSYVFSSRARQMYSLNNHVWKCNHSSLQNTATNFLVLKKK